VILPHKAFLRGAIVALALTGLAQAAGDPGKGNQIFDARCKACHSLEPGKHKIGPTLHGVFGRKAGSLADYNYSSAMKAANLSWNEETLRQYLADPHKFVPGDKMMFPGIKNEAQLDDLIAYLKEATQ
jgi:cytochrome c